MSSHNYGYDNLHRRTTATTEDATYWDYGYNDRSETTSGTKKLSGGTGITGWSFSYAYDNIGNRTSYSGGSESITYSSYNALNQPGSIGGGATYNVKGRTESTGSPAVTVDTVPQTVTTQTAGTKKYFNASVTAGSTPDYQLVSISDGSQSSDYNKFVPPASYGPSFDNDGNLIEDDRWIYTWDANNRLKKMETRTAAVYAGAPDWTLEFKYDAFGRRIEKKKTWAAYSYVEYTDIYVYDGWNLIARVRNGSLHQSYVWGLDLSGGMQGAGGVGGLLMTYTTSGGSVHFPAYDGNGNIMSLVNASTSVVEADYAYDPFGGLQRIRGTNLVEWDNPFRFSTKYTDDESGHLYYGYRYLDPRHGRWLGRDPIGEAGGLNLYGFVGNEGVNNWDALGNYPGSRGHGSISSPSDSVALMERIIADADSRIESQMPNRWYTFGEERAREAWRSRLRLRELMKQIGTDENNRFVYTCKYGWIDMGHFFNNAFITLGYNRSVGESLSELNERLQEFFGSNSAWTPEDLPSNELGRRFAENLERFERNHGTGVSIWRVPSRPFDFVAEWKNLLVSSGAVAWNPVVYGRTVEEWLIRETEQFQANPVQARTLEEALNYHRSTEAYRCLCDGDRPRFDVLIYQ